MYNLVYLKLLLNDTSIEIVCPFSYLQNENKYICKSIM